MSKDTHSSRGSVLVVGMGAYAFGREQRAVKTFRHLDGFAPYFLISKYEDGSVGALLEGEGFAFEHAPFGYLGFAKPHWTLVTLTQIPLLYFKLMRAYIGERCDTILVLGLEPILNALFPVVILKFFLKAHVVFYLGDIPADNRINRSLGWVANKLADRFLVISRAVQAGLRTLGVVREDVKIVYNGVEPDRFSDSAPINFRQTYGWPEDCPLVGYVGQLVPQKGIEDFVKAARLLLREGYKCRYILVGPIDPVHGYQSEIAGYVEQNGLDEFIAFTGRIDDVERVYAATDIVIMPSRCEEALGNVHIEAMASGVPVIATEVGGIPEVVVDGETGLLVEKESPEQIAAAVRRLLEDEDFRSRLICAGERRVRRCFDVRQNVQAVAEALRRD